MNKNRNIGRLTVNLGLIFLLLEGFCGAISFCTNQKQINFCNTEISTSIRILLKQVLTQIFS